MRFSILVSRFSLPAACLCLAVLTPSLTAALPDWLAAAAKLPTPDYCGQASAVVLVDQTRVTVDAEGNELTVHRMALRILTRQGAGHAGYAIPYIGTTERVRSNDGWLVRGGKIEKHKSGGDWVDVLAASYGAIYDEYRAKFFSFSSEVTPDDVVGFESRVEGQPLFNQFFESFGGPLPIVEQQYQIEVPAGWSIHASAENDSALTPMVSADRRSQSWTLQAWPFHPSEPMTVPREAVAPVVFGGYSPPGDAKGIAPRFDSWSEVAAWQARLADPQCDSSPALSNKARQLTADSSNMLAKIRALCGYVQNFHYIATNRDIGIGFGYRPRKSSEVVAKEFGDCKDKVNALRALLREVGITSHAVIVRMDQNHSVRPAWPSPLQFNHAIIAIEVDDSVQLPAVTKTEKWGRLLIFDPTDPYTPVGSLPWLEQGTKAMLSDVENGGLFGLPVLPSEKNWLINRQAELNFSAEGGVRGKATIVSHGQAGARIRHLLLTDTAKQLHDEVTENMAGALAGVQVTKLVTKNEPEADRCEVAFEFSSPKFSQRMPGGMELVRLDIFGRGRIPVFAEKDRRMPVKLEPSEQRDEVVLALPEGAKVVEKPAAVVLDSPFGHFESSFAVTEGQITFNRSVVLHATHVAPADYRALKKFLADVVKASQATVLLQRN